MAEKPLSPAETDGATKAAFKVAAWGVVIFGATRIASLMLESTSMAAMAAQAVIAEWGAGRLGVAWSTPLEPMPSMATILRRAAQGVLMGAVLGSVVLAFMVFTGAIRMTSTPTSLSILGVGLVTSGLLAMRDELLLHGVTLRAVVTLPSPALRILACGIVSGGAAFGDPGVTPKLAAVQALFGLVTGALWILDRGAWRPWGASTGFVFVTQVLAHGGVADTAVAANSWGGADAGMLGGGAAIVALLPAGAAAIVLASRLAGPGVRSRLG